MGLIETHHVDCTGIAHNFTGKSKITCKRSRSCFVRKHEIPVGRRMLYLRRLMMITVMLNIESLFSVWTDSGSDGSYQKCDTIVIMHERWNVPEPDTCMYRLARHTDHLADKTKEREIERWSREPRTETAAVINSNFDNFIPLCRDGSKLLCTRSFRMWFIRHASNVADNGSRLRS